MSVCTKCSECEALIYHAYCYSCLRVSRKQPPTPKFRSDRKNKLCSRCKSNERAAGKNYCRECANLSLREWRTKKRGYPLPKPVLSKRTCRSYINTLRQRGKVEYGPCYICGDSAEHFHHLSYEPRSKNVVSLCKPCHVRVHRALRRLDRISLTA